MRPIDLLPDYFDPIPRAIPRVSRVLGIVKWIGVSILILALVACILGMLVLDYLWVWE